MGSVEPVGSAMNEVGETVKQEVIVQNQAGLHARPAAVLAGRVREFPCDVHLTLLEVPEDLGVEIGTRVDAKSVMEVLFLAAPKDTRLLVEAQGTQAQEALDVVVGLFAERFGVE